MRAFAATVAATATSATMRKALTYRAVSFTNTLLVGFWLTGSLSAAASFGVTSLVANTAIYFAFERVWGWWTAPAVPTLATA